MFGKNKIREKQVDVLARAMRDEKEAFTAPVDVQESARAAAVLRRAVGNSTPSEHNAALKRR